MARGTVLTRNRVAGITALLGVVASLFAALTGLIFLLGIVPWGAFIAAMSWLAWYRPERRVADLSVAPDGVRADGVLIAARGSLRSGDAAERPDGRWQVDLHRWLGQRTRLVVDTAEQARGILAALGFDRRAGTSSFRVRRRSMLTFDVTVFATLVSGAFAGVASDIIGTPWPLFVPIALLAYGIASSWRLRLTVGSDGITIGRRFIPFSRISYVGPSTLDERMLEIGLQGEDPLVLDTSPERLRAGAMRDHVRVIVHDAWIRARRAAQPNATSLLKGDKNVRDWIAALRAGGDGGYRVAAIDDEELLAIVTDATSSQEARAAAAVALAAKAEQAPRLRVAADDVADPVVRRIALAALDDEAHLEDELDAAFRSK